MPSMLIDAILVLVFVTSGLHVGSPVLKKTSCVVVRGGSKNIEGVGWGMEVVFLGSLPV